MAKLKKKVKIKAKQAKSTQSPPSKAMKKEEQEMDEVDELVKQTGEEDKGEVRLELCPRCGSTDLGIRVIDIPGFSPEVQICNRCGFRSESSLETTPIKYFEEVDEEEGDFKQRIAEIEKRVQSGEYTTAEGKRRTASVKAAGRKAKAARVAKQKPTPGSKPKKAPKLNKPKTRRRK